MRGVGENRSLTEHTHSTRTYFLLGVVSLARVAARGRDTTILQDPSVWWRGFLLDGRRAYVSCSTLYRPGRGDAGH